MPAAASEVIKILFSSKEMTLLKEAFNDLEKKPADILDGLDY